MFSFAGVPLRPLTPRPLEPEPWRGRQVYDVAECLCSLRRVPSSGCCPPTSWDLLHWGGWENEEENGWNPHFRGWEVREKQMLRSVEVEGICYVILIFRRWKVREEMLASIEMECMWGWGDRVACIYLNL